MLTDGDLTKLRSLSLRGQGLRAGHIRRIAESAGLRGLEELDIAENDSGFRDEAARPILREAGFWRLHQVSCTSEDLG